MKVSILIPTYNRAHFLVRCLESVLHQTHDNLEIIVYDDGSTDHTDDVMRAFTDERITWYRGEKNLGDAGARNKLLDYGTCQYAAWQDADDLSNKYRIEMQLEAIRHFKAPFCRCAGVPWTKETVGDETKPPVLRPTMNRVTPSTMFHLPSGRKTRYDERIYLGSDIIWEMQMTRDHGAGISLPWKLYHTDHEAEDRLTFQYKNNMEIYKKGMVFKNEERKRLTWELRHEGIPRWPIKLEDKWCQELFERVCGR